MAAVIVFAMDCDIDIDIDFVAISRNSSIPVAAPGSTIAGRRYNRGRVDPG